MLACFPSIVRLANADERVVAGVLAQAVVRAVDEAVGQVVGAV